MIAAWMLYVIAFTAIYGSAAWAVERGRAVLGQPRRGAWAGALILTVFVAGITLVQMQDDLALPGLPPEIMRLASAAHAPAVSAPATATTAPAVASPRRLPAWIRPRLEIPAEARLGALDRPLLVMWAAFSTAMFVVLIGSAWRMVRARRTWRRVDVDGAPVYVSDNLGPAVIGLFPGRIVVPSWILEAPAAQRRLILAHEREHLDARDPASLFLATLALVLMPWNVALWWITRRQRLAVEADCDARVMTLHADRRAYADLLLDMSERAIAHSVPLTALAESRWMLEHRLEAIGARRPSHAMLRGAVYYAAGIALAVVACAAPRPSPSMDSAAFDLALAPTQPREVPRAPDIYESVLTDSGFERRKTFPMFVRADGGTEKNRSDRGRFSTATAARLCGTNIQVASGWAPWQQTAGSASDGDFPGAPRDDAAITARLVMETRMAYPRVFAEYNNKLHLVGLLFDSTGKVVDRMTCTRPGVREGEFLNPMSLVRALFPLAGRGVAAGVRGISRSEPAFAPGNRIDVIAVWGVVDQ